MYIEDVERPEPVSLRPGSGAISSAVHTPAVGGSTRLYPVFGYPVAQVKAPALYNEVFAGAGVDAVVIPIEASERVFPTLLKAMFASDNVRGAFVTIPHKVATARLVDSASEAVRIADSCNAVVRRPDGKLHGDLFDGVGLVRALARHGFDPSGARCLVVGAGGAGAAIGAALAGAGAEAVRFADCRDRHARSLADRIGRYFPRILVDAGPARIAGFDLVVNATPCGMEPGDAPPIDIDELTPSVTVAEIVMKRDVTPLVAAARSRGCRTMLGHEMLREQVPFYLEFFGLPGALGRPIDVALSDSR